VEIEAGLLWQLVTGLILAGAVYGGIRQDLRAMHESLRRVEKMAERAHSRLDQIGLGMGTRRDDVR
jgi:hypothetical protein